MKKVGFQYLVTLFILAVITYLWFFYVQNSGAYQEFLIWTEQHQLILFIFLIIIKIAGIIWPPIPGGFIIFAAIPILGWFNVFLADLIGGVSGGMIVYFIGMKWGYGFIRNVFGEDIEKKMHTIKIKKNREIESIIFFRFTMTGFAEFVCYGAGLLRVTFWKFVAADIIAHILLGIPIYYLGEEFFVNKNFLFTLIVIITGFILIFLLKDRYIEHEKTRLS